MFVWISALHLSLETHKGSSWLVLLSTGPLLRMMGVNAAAAELNDELDRGIVVSSIYKKHKNEIDKNK